MEDEVIVENMKAVLKSAKKKKAAVHSDKSRVQNKNGNNSSSTSSKDDELISELMTKNWQMKSPIDEKNANTSQQQHGITSGKKLTNAFEKLMSATRKTSATTVSPSSQKSDTSPKGSATTTTTMANGNKKKKKRKWQRKRSKVDAEKFETESDLSVLDEESLQETFTKSARQMRSQPPDDTHSKSEQKPLESIPLIDFESGRKRNRINDTEIQQQQHQLEKPVKKRKTREVLLDSNENSLPSPLVTDVKEEEEKHGTGRPKRSCSNKVDYAALLFESPEKEPEGLRKRRKAVHKPKYDAEDDSFETVEIDENSPVKKQPPRPANPVKLAPLFVKKIPKPALDPCVAEARKNFLLSELPANLRAPIDKQKKFEEEILSNNLIAYPLVSHVRQGEVLIDCDDGRKLYSESKIRVSADSKDDSDDDDDENEACARKLERGTVCDYEKKSSASSALTRELVENIKASVRAIKDKCESFPTNRCFKQILSKLKSARGSDEAEAENVSSNLSYQHSLFIDIFKPTGYDDYLIGAEPVKRLQEFLTTWNEKNARYDSDEDSSSRHSMRSSNNFAVLSGKHGSGKSSSVYALANDLNYEVIEINAGSKRNGKKILSDLLEATQSHRVEKHLVDDDEDAQSGGAFDGGSDVGKRTILLIEDAELIFENEDGFISSIQQLINISKRPVILTTNDRSCQHLQKFIQYNEINYDNPKSYVTKYLSLISLATSNYKIDEAEIEHLYALNGCDLRKTINEIEFFIRSDSASISGGSLMGLYGNNSKNTTTHKRAHKGQLAPCGNQQPPPQRVEDLLKLRFESSIMASQHTAMMCSWRAEQEQRSSRGDEISYHQHNFMNEMGNYFEPSNVLQMEYEHDFAGRQQRIISRSISNEINTGNVSARAKALDYAPMLRGICRSEKKIDASKRKSCRNHYLKYFMSSSANLSQYFDEQSRIFETNS